MTVRDDETSGCSASRAGHDPIGGPTNGRATGPRPRIGGRAAGRRPAGPPTVGGATGGRPASLPSLCRRTNGPENAAAGDPWRVAGTSGRWPAAVVCQTVQMGRTVSACGPFAPWLPRRRRAGSPRGCGTVRLNGRVVDEDVRAVVVSRDEAEALLGVEPLDGALRHTCSPHVTRTRPAPRRPVAVGRREEKVTLTRGVHCRQALREGPLSTVAWRATRKYDCNRRRTYHGKILRPAGRALVQRPPGSAAEPVPGLADRGSRARRSCRRRPPRLRDCWCTCNPIRTALRPARLAAYRAESATSSRPSRSRRVRGGTARRRPRR